MHQCIGQYFMLICKKKKYFLKSLSGTILNAKQYRVESWKTQYTLSILQRAHLGSRAGRTWRQTEVNTGYCSMLSDSARLRASKRQAPSGRDCPRQPPQTCSFSWRVCWPKDFLSAWVSILAKEECHGCRNRANRKATQYLWHKCMGLVFRKC